MTNISDLSVSQLKRAVQIKEQIEKLQAQLSQILGEGAVPKSNPAQKSATLSKPAKKRQMSAAARAKIAAAAKRRWAKVKAAGKKTL